MAKYADNGRSPVRSKTPFRPNEPWHLRHVRRLQTALSIEPMVRNWCELHGIALTVKEGGWAWELAKGGKRATWRPAAATLYLFNPSSRNIHCHDFTQLQACLRQRWKLKPIKGIEG